MAKLSDEERLKNIPWVREMRAAIIDECAHRAAEILAAKGYEHRECLDVAAAICALKQRDER